MARREEFSVGKLWVGRIEGPGSPASVAYPTYGKRLFVDSVHGVNNNDGLSEKTALDSVVHALTRCTADYGDVIFCLPGHVESVIAAAGLVFSIAGVTVIFLGNGVNRAKVNFGTGAVVGSDINITAAGVTLINPLFVSAIDALTGPIHITAADVSIINAEYRDAAGLAVTHAIVASSAADRLKINGWKYVVSTTGTQKHSNIQLAGSDHIELRNIEIEGDFNVAPIEGVAACTNIILENIYVNNTNSGNLGGLNLHADTTGFAKNVKARTKAGTTYVTSVAKIQWADDCEGFSTDGYGGDPIGTSLATGLEGQIIKMQSDLVIADTAVDKLISDLTVADGLVDTVKSDLIITLSDLKATGPRVITIASDLVILDTVADSIKSDLIISQSDLKITTTRVVTIASDLVILDTVADSIKSDLIVLDAIGDTIKSDLIIVMSDIKIDQPRIVTIASDLLLVDTVVDSIKSDLIVADALIDTIKSDLIISQSDIKAEGTRVITIASDIVIAQTRQVTIASDLVILDTVADKISSDVIVAQTRQVTIASDLVIVDTVVDKVSSDIVAYLTKYASDITALMSDLATKT